MADEETHPPDEGAVERMRMFDMCPPHIRDFINEYDGHPRQVVSHVRNLRYEGEAVSEYLLEVDKLARRLLGLRE